MIEPTLTIYRKKLVKRKKEKKKDNKGVEIVVITEV
jgi:hypothetical protein